MELPSRERWAPRKAESVLSELENVRSCRVVTGIHGRVSEIHVLATDLVPAKKLVRSIESALLVHFGRNVDRKMISIAQVRTRLPTPVAAAPPPTTQIIEPQPSARPEVTGLGRRMELLSHEVAGKRGQGIGVRVQLKHLGKRYEGEAQGTDAIQSRLDAMAKATLVAVEAAARDELELQGREPVSLALEGVTLASGFVHPSVLVSVTATNGRDVTALVGAASARKHKASAAILATLQATNRWIQGQPSRLSETPENRRNPLGLP